MSTETVIYRNHKINIVQDVEPDNPCEAWEQMGVMWCEHPRYSLGHDKAHGILLSYCFEHDPSFKRLCYRRKAGKQDIIKSLTKLKCVLIPLYLLDHSGLSISTSAFSCPWDSGGIGLIVATPQKIRECYGIKNVTKRRRAQAVESLNSQVKEYDDYLTGNVYAFDIVDESGDVIDSCCGFYGYDHKKSGLLETAKAEIDHLDRQMVLEFAA